MKVLYVLWLILAGLLVGILALITFPLLLLYVGVKIIGGRLRLKTQLNK